MVLFKVDFSWYNLKLNSLWYYLKSIRLCYYLNWLIQYPSSSNYVFERVEDYMGSIYLLKKTHLVDRCNQLHLPLLLAFHLFRPRLWTSLYPLLISTITWLESRIK